MKQSEIDNQDRSKKQNNTSQCGCSSMDTQSKQKCSTSTNITSEKSKNSSTKIIIKYNCGFPNNLFIRGEGISDLNWDRGVAMKNIKSDEWMWETDKPFNKAQFKVLLNDRVYEQGPNHSIECGKTGIFSPKF